MKKGDMNLHTVVKFILPLFLLFLFSFKPRSDAPLKIVLQPFSDVPAGHIAYLYKELSKLYPHLVLLKAIDLPKSAYYAPRNRYRADSLISFLKRRTPDGKVTMGLTSKDISVTKDNIKDYGIMGLAYQPGRSGVVSYYRLSKKNTFQQYFKVMLHELGHTQGLPHCPVTTCFMRDAKGENHNDDEKDFCPKCKTHLQAKGWNLKQD